MSNYKFLNRILAAFAFLASFFVYWRTISPTVSFWDCGEFISCSYMLAIPHPPGAPLYLLVGRLFSMLPIAADIALRVNIVSALVSGITIMLTYLIIVRLTQQWRGKPNTIEEFITQGASGLLGALTYAYTDTFWFNSVEAEVYAGSMLFTALIVWLILLWVEKAEEPGNERYLLMIAYLVGLATGVHLLMVLALPVIFIIVYFKYLQIQQEKITWKNLGQFAVGTIVAFVAVYPGVVQYLPWLAEQGTLLSILLLIIILFVGAYFALTNRKKILSLALMSFLLVIVGYSTYSEIYIRSGLDPVIDENDPENIPQMIKYLNREQYGGMSTFPRKFPGLPPDWQFTQEYPYMSYWNFNFSKQLDFFWNYQIKKMYIRYFGWQFIGKGTTLDDNDFIVETISLHGLMGLPFIIGLIGMVHHFYRDKRHALSVLALFFLTGLAIILYLNQEDPQPRDRDYVYVGSFFAFALWIGIGLTAILEWIQESFQNKAVQRRVLSAVVIIAFALMAPINLLANNYKEHDRTGNFVAFDYSYNILQSCEPNGIVFTNGDNDTFPLWFLQYVYNIRTDVRVVNLSLLNTPWYIKQLKHQEPKVPISLTDEEIDQLEIMRWEPRTIKIPVPDQVRTQFTQDLGETKQMLTDVANTPSELTVEVKPTVFGQALRVQDFMILNILYANKWNKPVYFAVTVSDQNKVNLQNYLRMDGLAFKLVPFSGDFLSTEKLENYLFNVFQYRNLNNPAVYYNENIVGLLQNYRAAFLRLAHEYMSRKQNDKMADVLDHMEKVMPSTLIPAPDVRIYLQVGQMYEMAGRPDEFLKYTELAAQQEPDNALALGTLISLYGRKGYHDKAVAILEKWVAQNPTDTEAARRLEQEKKLVGQSQDTLAPAKITAPAEADQTPSGK
jgi:hypothetical protein